MTDRVSLSMCTALGVGPKGEPPRLRAQGLDRRLALRVDHGVLLLLLCIMSRVHCDSDALGRNLASIGYPERGHPPDRHDELCAKPEVFERTDVCRLHEDDSSQSVFHWWARAYSTTLGFERQWVVRQVHDRPPLPTLCVPHRVSTGCCPMRPLRHLAESCGRER